MIQQEVTIYLNCQVDQVFAFLADAKNLQSWQSNLVENEQLTEGPVQVGTRFREVRRVGLGESEIQAEVTIFDEMNKLLGTRTITKPQVTVLYALEIESGGTRLNYKFNMLPSGIMRLLEPFLAGSILKGNELDLQKLRRVLEH
jgi:hypothetical protein